LLILVPEPQVLNTKSGSIAQLLEAPG